MTHGSVPFCPYALDEMPTKSIAFPPFNLDIENERLWKGSSEVLLRRKPFYILRYLASHPQRLVSQEELVREVWGDIAVSESAIRTQLYYLRQCLGEGIVETVVGRGYRFLPAIAQEPLAPQQSPEIARAAANDGVVAPAATAHGKRSPSSVRVTPVGRGEELDMLTVVHERAAAGERQMVFIIGEPGIGKTTLLDAFLSDLSAGSLVVRGQCVEQSGHGEPYFPLLEGLRRLCESTEGATVAAVLARRAPTWLMQMPGLFPDMESRELVQRTAGATQDRMVREFCEVLEHLSVERPVVVALEDLQWSDLSTINIVSVLGSRRASARLLVIGSARNADLLNTTHPLNTIYRELVGRGLAQVISPGVLSESEVAHYLGRRFSAHDFPATLATVVHQITGGTPIFMVSVLDDLVKQKMIERRLGGWSMRCSVEEIAKRRPDNVRQLIDIQLDRLTDAEQRVLEISSALGMNFSAGLVAAALESSVDFVEEICDGLVRREHALLALGSMIWPDGTTHSGYAFRHNLYRAVALERSPVGRRRAWHRRFADRLLAAYKDSAAEVCVELALHFEGANEWSRAAEFYAVAGERASSKFAGLDATIRFKAGLDLIKYAPASSERDAIELRLLTGIAPRLIEQQLADPPWSEVHARILVLTKNAGLDSPPWSTVFGTWLASFILGDLRAAITGAERLVSMAEGQRDSELLAAATSAQAAALFFRGDLAKARVLSEKSLAIFDVILGEGSGDGSPLEHPESFIGTSRSLQASLLAVMGYLDQAKLAADSSVEESRSVKNPFALTLDLTGSARMYFWRREPEKVLETAQQAAEISAVNGFPVWRTETQVLLGWARVMLKNDVAGLRDIEKGLAESLSFGRRGTSFLATVHGEACYAMGEVDRGLSVLAEAIAFAEDSGEVVFAAELHRINGLLLGNSDRTSADAFLRRSLELAQSISAKAFELRAAMALVRLWQSGKQRAEAVSSLAAAFGWFTEGFSVADLREAKQLLDGTRGQSGTTRRRLRA